MVLVGLQASGKTTFARERFAATHVHVSKDLMPNVRRKDRRQAALVGAALSAGRSVVVDNTNPTPEERRPLIELGRAHGARVVGYFFATRVADAVARNERREGRARVPLVGIYATAKRLQPPSPDEGFGALFRVRLVPGGGFAVAPQR